MPTIVNMHEAKSNLSALIGRVLEGEEVTIARSSTPLVDLVIHKPVRIVYGRLPGLAPADPAVFDGPDVEISELFYGAQEDA